MWVSIWRRAGAVRCLPVVALVAALLGMVCIIPAYADVSPGIEAEGPIGDHIYLRGFAFTDPGHEIGLLGLMEQRPLANGGNVKGLLWFRATSDGGRWIGPEIWPHVKVGKWTLDAEVRYLWGLSDSPNGWQLIPTAQYSVGAGNQIGAIGFWNAAVGHGQERQAALGPIVTHTLSAKADVSLYYLRGIEGHPGNEIVVDFIFK